MRSSAVLVASVLFGLVAAQTQPTQTYGQYTVTTVYNGTNCQGAPIAIRVDNNWDTSNGIVNPCIVYPCQVDGLFQNTVANLNYNAFVTSSKTSCTNSPFVAGEVAPLTLDQQNANPPVTPYLARVTYTFNLATYDASKQSSNTLACSGIASTASIAPIQNYGGCNAYNTSFFTLSYFRETCVGSTYLATYYTDALCQTPVPVAGNPISGCVGGTAYICTNESSMLTFSAFALVVAALVAVVARV